MVKRVKKIVKLAVENRNGKLGKFSIIQNPHKILSEDNNLGTISY